MTVLADTLRPCGPVLDEKAANRALEPLAAAAQEGGWSKSLETAAEALAPVFAASTYLAGLARRAPQRLAALLQGEPHRLLADLLERTRAASALAPEPAGAELRRLKAEAHLLIALCDLGGLWGLDEVTGALTRFADASVQACLESLARAELASGQLTRIGEGEEGPVPGWFCIAMGKHGAFELNYSSDIDISVFYEPDALPLADGVEPQPFCVRLTKRLAETVCEMPG